MTSGEKIEAIAVVDKSLADWVSEQRGAGFAVEEIIDKLRYAMSICERPHTKEGAE